MDAAERKHVRLPDGTVVLLRWLRPDDEERLEHGFEQLSARTRHQRFLAGLKHLSSQQLHSLTHTDGDAHLALAMGIEDHSGVEEGIAVARSIREPSDPTIAEFAIVVVDEWQGRGVGKVLTRALAEEARRHGIRSWRALMLSDNERVRKVLAGVGTETSRNYPGDGSVEILYSLMDPADQPPVTGDGAAR